MSRGVNLLLLLSALLSALAGVGGHARQPQVAQALAQPAAQAVSSAAARARAARPAVALPTLAASAEKPVALVFALAAAEPLYAARRRE